VSDDEELFHHEVTPMTLGQFRAATAGLPDDLVLDVKVGETPGGDFCDEQVVTAVHGPADDDPPEARVVEISCDFPTGDYYRPRGQY